MIKLIRLLVVTALLTLSGSAANVTWTNSLITGDSSILNTGTQLYGYMLYQDPPTTTVNGASFVSTYDVTSDFDFNGGLHFNSYQTAFTTNAIGYSTGMSYLLNSAFYRYDNVGYINPFTINFTTYGLIAGHQYDVQFLIVDDRVGSATRTEYFTGGTNSSATINLYEASGAANSVVGNFVADSTSQLFTITGVDPAFGLVAINAFQVRDLGVAAVPEASTWFLTTASLLLFVFVGRRRLVDDSV